MENLLKSINELIPFWLTVSSCFLLAFGITFSSVPTIVNVAQMKNLCAKPNKRSSHLNEIPNLGGVAIFIGFVISIILIAGKYFTSEFFYIIAALIILFFIGMKDDILVIDPRKKLFAQVMVAFIISIFTDIKIVHIFDQSAAQNIPYVLSILLTVFVLLAIINGFNLIDGIDGLASGAGILNSLVFGLFFWKIRNIEYTAICFALSGSLAAFFIYNVFGKKNKIFLGDTGSLLVGLTIGVIAVRFIHTEAITGSGGFIRSAPALTIGILILPLFDTLRIFTIRIFQGKSPFIADHQHIHHRLLELGFSHLKSTLILLSINVIVIGLCFLLQDTGNIMLGLIILAVVSSLSYILVKLASKHTKRRIMVEYYQSLFNEEAIKSKKAPTEQFEKVQRAKPHAVEI